MTSINKKITRNVKQQKKVIFNKVPQLFNFERNYLSLNCAGIIAKTCENNSTQPHPTPKINSRSSKTLMLETKL